MHVLQVSSAKGWGGGEVHVLGLSHALVQAGCRITIACRPDSPLARAAAAEGFDVLPVLSAGTIQPRAAWKLRAFCLAEHVDVLHGHQVQDWSTGRLAASGLPGVRVVVTRHLARVRGSNPWKTWVARGLHRIIAVSGAVAAELAGKVPPHLVAVVHNGIDVERFASAPRGALRSELGLDANVPLVGLCGRLSGAKGQALLLRAAPAIRARHPSTRFVFLGGDADGGETTEALQALARELGVADAVHFLGHRDDLPRLVPDLTVATLPSRQEALGLALVEAMAANVPVVAARVGGIPELVVHRESGLLFESGDAGALADAVVELLSDPALAARLGAAGQARVRAGFSLESMARGTLAAYGDGVVAA